MKYSDADLTEAAHQAERDQDRAEIAEMASDVGMFYRELKAAGVPVETAASITEAFARLVVFGVCECVGIGSG